MGVQAYKHTILLVPISYNSLYNVVVGHLRGAMAWRISSLKVAVVFIPMGIAFNDLVLGVVPITGDSHAVRQERAYNGDKSYMLVNKWGGSKMRRGEITLGDLVVMTDPSDPHRRIIRKVGGMPDQWVRVNDGTGSYHVYVRKGYCWVEGRETSNTEAEVVSGDQKEKGEATKGKRAAEDTVMEAVKSRHDSLTFGPISMGLIIGSPIMVVGPMRRFGGLNRMLPNGGAAQA
jgi:signal peptidase I